MLFKRIKAVNIKHIKELIRFPRVQINLSCFIAVSFMVVDVYSMVCGIEVELFPNHYRRFNDNVYQYLIMILN